MLKSNYLQKNTFAVSENSQNSRKFLVAKVFSYTVHLLHSYFQNFAHQGERQLHVPLVKYDLTAMTVEGYEHTCSALLNRSNDTDPTMDDFK